MTTTEQLHVLLAEVGNAITAVDSDITGDARKKLLAAARNLTYALEDPLDSVYRFALHPYAHACGLVAWERNILSPWPKETMTSAELAELAGINAILLTRIMRALQLYGIFIEVEEEVYRHTVLSAQMSESPRRSNAYYLAANARQIEQLPEYLAEVGFGNPGADPSKPTLFEWINKTDQELFQWMTKNEDKTHLNKFNEVMARSIETDRASSGKTTLDAYPFAAELADVGPDEVAVVDVGGGYGHLLREFRAKIPEVKGKLVLEDLPETVKGAPGVVPSDNVDIQGYNFFTQEQPVKGARFYILRHVLHDWPDHACRKILHNTIPALVKGRSKILLFEVVLDQTNHEGVFGPLMDVNMMKYGGMGRKERQWRAVVESAGLKMVRVLPGPKNDSIMECVPQEWS